MQARGLAGFYSNNELKLIYQNDNAEPSKLGARIFDEPRPYGNDLTGPCYLENVVEGLRGVSEHTLVNDRRDVINQMKRHFPQGQINTSATDMAELFEPFQGSLQHYLSNELQFYPYASDFIRDGKFCQWAYVVNLDDRRFDVLKGDQGEPESLPYNLGQVSSHHHYDNELAWPCQIVQSYDLQKLPEKTKFLSDLSK